MKCDCATLPDLFYLDESPKGFKGSLHEEETGDWVRLFSCQICGTLWVIDEPDKFWDEVVIRVKSDDRSTWSGNENIEGRKHLLLKSRGGTTEEKCAWAGCQGKCVKGVAFCLEHLWETGARR
jgi:hypothetical protein